MGAWERARGRAEVGHERQGDVTREQGVVRPGGALGRHGRDRAIRM